MDKGLLSSASQDVIYAKVGLLLKDQKPVTRLAVTILLKAVFLYADDIIAENKLPQELTDKSQQFFDAILVEADIDKAIILGLDLVPIIYALFKPVEVPAIKK